MVAHEFPPLPGATAYRMDFRVRSLVERGWSVAVFTPGPVHEVVTPGEGLTIHRIPPVLGSPGTLDYTVHGTIRGAGMLRPLGGYLRWLPSLLSRLRAECTTQDLLYTYNNPVSLHLAGLALRSRVRAWVAEFRDPIRGYEYSQRGLLGSLVDGWLERRVLARADVVCMREGIQARPTDYPSLGARRVALPDFGVDLEQFRDFPPPPPLEGTLRGVFAGSLYGGLTLAPLDEAVGAMAGALTPQLDFFGKPDPAYTSVRHIRYGGLLPFVQLMDRYRLAHFVILFDESRSDAGRAAGFVPSKLAELVAIGRPILFIGNVQSRAAELIRTRRMGECVENETAAIAEALQAIADGLNNNVFHLQADADLLRRIDMRQAETEFHDLLSSLR